MKKNNHLIQLCILLLIIATVFISCEKDYYTKLRENEQKELDEYISTYYPDLEPTNDGMYFIELEEGTGRQPEFGDKILFHYEGSSLNGIIFDSTEGERARTLENLGYTNIQNGEITGWHLALIEMKEGGKAKIILPSQLAFSRYGSNAVPPYTSVVYTIEFLRIENTAPEI